MADDTIVGFNDSDARELLKLIKGQSSIGSMTSDAQSDNATWLGVTTSTITARAGSTMGTGTVQVKWINSSNVAANLHTIDVINAGSAIANGAWVIVFRVGNKFVAVEVC